MAKKSKPKGKAPLEPSLEVSEVFAPLEKDHWRLIVDFPADMEASIRAEADRLGINMQAVVKTLCDEALRLRRSQGVKVKGA